MTARSVLDLHPATRTIEGGGFVVTRPFPTRGLDLFDPFLLLDEMGPVEYAPGQAKGAPDHPHRGFETVTYLLAGSMEHKNSAGNAGKLTAGDVQWMTAGKGVVHSEMPSREMQQRGGRMHGFQLWVNLPQRDKMIAPRYQEIPATKIPKAQRDGVLVRVIAGTSLGASAVIDTRTPIVYLHVTMQPGASFEQPIAEGLNAFAYLIDGEALFGSDQRVGRDAQMVIFDNDGDTVNARVPDTARGPADFLLLAGQPLREPVARYGPFVMNTREEIMHAIEDYQTGRLGRIY